MLKNPLTQEEISAVLNQLEWPHRPFIKIAEKMNLTRTSYVAVDVI